MAKVVLREGPKDGSYESLDAIGGTVEANASELHVPALDVSVTPPRTINAIYRRDPENIPDAMVWRFHRSEPIYRTTL